MSKNLIIAVLAVSFFVIGSAMTVAGVYPTPVIKRTLQSVGIGREPVSPLITGYPVEGDVNDTSQQGTIKGDKLIFKSNRLGASITVLPGVFNPYEAENAVLALMEDQAELFKAARVMEIGTGSGIISLYAAKLGAVKVVSTDINPLAIETITLNAKDLGYDDIVEPRLVSLDDISAYAVIGDDEVFDIIISNPPYALDLDATANDAVTDTGELGFSIVRGLNTHLADDGVAILWYNSLFYHDVMVKFADYQGYTVRSHLPNGLFQWAAESLFNSYLQRLLVAEGLPTDAFHFDYSKDKSLNIQYLRNPALQPYAVGYEPLFPEGNKKRRYYAGTLVIEHNETTLNSNN